MNVTENRNPLTQKLIFEILHLNIYTKGNTKPASLIFASETYILLSIFIEFFIKWKNHDC